MIIEQWPTDKIKPYPQNAKRHKVKWIAKSIEQFSFDQPIVVDGTGMIIKGHGRWEAAKYLKMETVPVLVRADLTDEQVRLSRLADNRCNQGGGYDAALLTAEIEDLAASIKLDFLEDLGFNDAFLRKFAKEDLFFDFDDDPNTDTQADIPAADGQKRFALSIVLTREQAAAWDAYKERCGKKTDTAAFIHMLEKL